MAKEEKAIDPMEELVPVRLFKDGDKYNDDVFVAVNGERIKIRRGVTVHIKRKFAEVLERSLEQDARTASMIDRAGSEYRETARGMGF